MFGKRGSQGERLDEPRVISLATHPTRPSHPTGAGVGPAPAQSEGNVRSFTASAASGAQPLHAAAANPPANRKTDEYYELKTQVFAALIDAIDVAQLSKMDTPQAREAIGDIVNDIVTAKKIVMSIAE